MKKIILLLTTGILIFSFLAPVAASASLTKAKARTKAIAACKDRDAGDSVQYINKAGKRIWGICREENGRLIAVPVNK